MNDTKAMQNKTHTTMENFLNNHIEFRFSTEAERKQSIKFAKEVLDMYEGKIREMRKNGASTHTSEALNEAIKRRNATRQAYSKLVYRTSVKK